MHTLQAGAAEPCEHLLWGQWASSAAWGVGTTLRNTRSRTGMCVAYAWDLGRGRTKTCFYKPSPRVSILVVPVECPGTCPRRRALASEQQEGSVPVRGAHPSAPPHSRCSAFSSPCADGPGCPAGRPRDPPRGAPPLVLERRGRATRCHLCAAAPRGLAGAHPWAAGGGNHPKSELHRPSLLTRSVSGALGPNASPTESAASPLLALRLLVCCFPVSQALIHASPKLGLFRCWDVCSPDFWRFPSSLKGSILDSIRSSCLLPGTSRSAEHSLQCRHRELEADYRLALSVMVSPCICIMFSKQLLELPTS